MRRRCVRKKLLNAAGREWEEIWTGMLKERAFKPFPVISLSRKLAVAGLLKPTWQTVRANRPFNSSGSWGESWLRTSQTVMEIHSQLASSRRCEHWASALRCRFFPNTRFTFENRTNCLLLGVSVRPSQLPGPSLLTCTLESKVRTYRGRGKSNSLPLCARCEGCSAASW